MQTRDVLQQVIEYIIMVIVYYTFIIYSIILHTSSYHSLCICHTFQSTGLFGSPPDCQLHIFWSHLVSHPGSLSTSSAGGNLVVQTWRSSDSEMNYSCFHLKRLFTMEHHGASLLIPDGFLHGSMFYVSCGHGLRKQLRGIGPADKLASFWKVRFFGKSGSSFTELPWNAESPLVIAESDFQVEVIFGNTGQQFSKCERF